MLSTFGLQRLEEALTTERTAADDVTKYLEQAARKALPQAAAKAETQHRHAEVHSRLSDDEPGLPTHPFAHARSNTQFHRTQYANRV
jgi:formate-dependent phosphoribosylglycinamide formyltransferase (GAR transformylase)